MTKRFIMCLALSLAAVAGAPAVHAQQIRLAVTMPQVPRSLPVFQLTSSEQPAALMNELLRLMAVDTGWKPLDGQGSSALVGVFEEGHLKAWMNTSTAEAGMFPTLAKLEAIPKLELGKGMQLAKAMFARSDFIPVDQTSYRIIPRGDLKMGRLDLEPGAQPIAAEGEYLSYFLAQRMAGEYPVEGPGSRAVVAVGARGLVHGMARVWRRAQKTTSVAIADPRTMRDKIMSQLSSSVSKGPFTLTVTDLRVVYYDANRNYLQPVVRFLVSIGAPSQPNPAWVVGYVPLVAGLDPLPAVASSVVPPRDPGMPSLQIPVLDPQPGGSVTAAPAPSSAQANVAGSNVPANNAATTAIVAAMSPVRVGRFIATFADDDAADPWRNSSTALFNALTTSSQLSFDMSRNEEALTDYVANSLITVSDPSRPNATNSGDVRANPSIGQVDLALFEAHGEPWHLYGYDVADAVVAVDALPAPPPQTAADWILHSCEVIPSEIDMPRVNETLLARGEISTPQAWHKPWRAIMPAVRSVVGYRTRMRIDDGAPAEYARRLANGAPLSSWFDVIAANNAELPSVLGRPSAVFLCHHASDTLTRPRSANNSRSLCIENWWLADCSGAVCPVQRDKVKPR